MSTGSVKRAQVIGELRVALATGEMQSVQAIRERCSSIPDRTWFRWQALAKDSGYSPITKRQLKPARAFATARQPSINLAADSTKPARPLSPATRTNPTSTLLPPVELFEGLDFLGRLQSLASDADLLHRSGLVLAPDGTTEVRDPIVVAHAIALKKTILSEQLRAAKELFKTQNTKTFIDEIVHVVRRLDPTAAVAALKEIQQVTRTYTARWPEVD